MTKATLLAAFLMMTSSAFCQKESAQIRSRFLPKEPIERRTGELNLFSTKKENRKDKAISIEVNQQVLAWVWEKEPVAFTLQIPLPEGGKQKLDFVKSRVLTDDFAITTSDGRKLYGKEYEGLHYQVKPGTNVKVGGISFREDGVMAMFSTESGNYNIGEMTVGKGDYVVSNDKDIEKPNWSCGSELLEPENDPTAKPNTTDKAATQICKTVRIYFESDYDLYVRAGSSISTASTFVTGLFNIVAQVYQNEGITVQMSGVFQWTTTDPYKALTNATSILYDFATNRPPAGINGDLTHLISARSTGLGGIGYVGVFCNPSVRHAFSSIYYQYSALPTYSWSVYCVSHEIGHNFGSRHTHWCGWSLPNGTTGRIDSCYAGEGTCGSTTRPRSGTVMSYCHVTSGGINFNLGFGTLPGKAIRDGLNAATCVSSSGCIGTASLKADSATNRNNSYLLTLTIPANHNATSWSVLEGTTVVQSGSLANQNAFSLAITISGKSNGSYAYTARLNSGTGTSTSAVVTVTVAVPTIVINSGICTATGLQAWYDATGKVNFKFGLSQTCNTYNVQMCRYNYQNPAVPPPAGATPAACGVRNSMSAYVPTTAERAANLIQRVASPQPSSAITPGMGSYWYSIDVLCTGTGCTTTNRTRTYIFVPGI
jgi:hypothetical protein